MDKRREHCIKKDFFFQNETGWFHGEVGGGPASKKKSIDVVFLFPGRNEPTEVSLDTSLSLC